MPVNPHPNNADRGADEMSLAELMNRIDQDVAAQKAVLRNDPSVAGKAAELLIVLREAKRRLATAASPVDGARERNRD